MGTVPGTRQDPDPRAQTPCRGPTVARAPAAGRGKYPTTWKIDRQKATSKMVIKFLGFFCYCRCLGYRSSFYFFFGFIKEC